MSKIYLMLRTDSRIDFVYRFSHSSPLHQLRVTVKLYAHTRTYYHITSLLFSLEKNEGLTLKNISSLLFEIRRKRGKILFYRESLW